MRRNLKPYPVVFQEKKRVGLYKYGNLTKSKTIQSSILIADGTLGLAIEISDLNDQQEHVIAFAIHKNDVIAAYRILKVVNSEEIVSQAIAAEVILAIFGVKSAQDIVRARQRTFDTVQSQLPPDLPKLLKKLQNFHVQFDKASIAEEVRKGNLKFSPEFREFGIETPEEVEKRNIGRETLLIPFEVHIQDWLRLRGHAPECKCREHELIKAGIALAFGDLGAEEDAALGFGLAISIATLYPPLPLPTLFGHAVQTQLLDIGKFLVERFHKPGRTPESYCYQLIELIDKVGSEQR